MTRIGLALALAIPALTSAAAGQRGAARDPATAAAALVRVDREAYLMGTRARMLIYAPSRSLGLDALDAAMTALEATEAELSTWRADSAVSSLNRAPIGVAWAAPAPVCAMFEDLYRWHRETSAAFDPAIGALTRAWGIHDAGPIPSSDEIAAALARSGLDRLVFDRASCTVTRTREVTLDVGAFGKGEALDRVAGLLAGKSWLVDLGGQVSVGGLPPDRAPWTIDIAHPAKRNQSIFQIRMWHGSLSTSGGSERDQRVDGQRVGHHLDPRTGRPAPFDGSVTVWHERGLVADILSTALYVMGPEDGLAWAEARGLSALYLSPDGSNVRTRATRAFERLRQGPAPAPSSQSATRSSSSARTSRGRFEGDRQIAESSKRDERMPSRRPTVRARSATAAAAPYTKPSEPRR